MKNLVLAALLVSAPCELWAADPVPCSSGIGRITAPRTQGRPIPLMSGDAEHGFRPACSVAWSALSPTGAPIAIAACFRGNLLQLDNDSVCAGVKGKLWVSMRWVVIHPMPTPVAAPHPAGDDSKGVVCQHVDTGSYAGTRGLPPPCVPRNP